MKKDKTRIKRKENREINLRTRNKISKAARKINRK